MSVKELHDGVFDSVTFIRVGYQTYGVKGLSVIPFSTSSISQKITSRGFGEFIIFFHNITDDPSLDSTYVPRLPLHERNRTCKPFLSSSSTAPASSFPTTTA